MNEIGIITGAATGMGKEIAKSLAEKGAKLILADINGKTLAETEKSLKAENADLYAVETDVTDEANVQRMVDTCMKKFSRIDFLVSNAGIIGPYKFEETTSAGWDETFSVNTKAGFLCAKGVLPHMQKQNSGRIIFNASTNGGKPGGHVIAYRASKAALIMFARSLALYAAPYGIRVNAICPGVTMTPIQKAMAESLLAEKGVTFEEYVEERASRIPLGRFTEVEDVANLVEFLISEKSAFITGQAIYINGGEW